MNDILIYEGGSGGQISIKNGDIEMTDGILNMPYLAHFGGNTEASTTGNEKENEERFDFWGNVFLEENAQMNSSLERTLNNTNLTSAGASKIEREAKNDIEFMSDIAKVSSYASITGADRLKITDKIDQLKIDFIFDSTKNEIIEEITI